MSGIVLQAQFYRFKCFTPADVVVTLNSFSDAADPLLFISVDPNTLPPDSSDSEMKTLCKVFWRS